MSDHEQQGHRVRRPAAAVALLLAIAGVIVLVIGFTAQRRAPQPPASAAIANSATATATATASAAQPRGPTGTGPTSRPASGPLLPRSVPTRLDIAAIGVGSDLLQLGLAPDRSVEVPPLGRDSRAGWYRYSPTPGQLGPSIILGHVDSAQYGPGVFFRLGALRPGNLIDVTRADHMVAVFRVDRVVSYPKNHFPTVEVYGNTNHAALRLITCGGKFDFTARSYLNNIVTYASLISSHRA